MNQKVLEPLLHHIHAMDLEMSRPQHKTRMRNVEKLHPKDWNNVPIPVCEAIDTLAKCLIELNSTNVL